MPSLRENMLQNAVAIEVETRGFLPASGWVNLIGKVIIPNAPAEERDPDLVVPIVMPVNSVEFPVQHPQYSRYGRVGMAVCFSDLILFAWMSGTVRVRWGHYTLKYSTISSAKAVQFDDILGIEVHEGSRIWSILFPRRLPGEMAEDYRSVLMERILLQPDG